MAGINPALVEQYRDARPQQQLRQADDQPDSRALLQTEALQLAQYIQRKGDGSGRDHQQENEYREPQPQITAPQHL
ncbi:hypothetical protein D3C84_1015280 [compost metagenome]